MQPSRIEELHGFRSLDVAVVYVAHVRLTILLALTAIDRMAEYLYT